jgi:hypothetical protein
MQNDVPEYDGLGVWTIIVHFWWVQRSPFRNHISIFINTMHQSQESREKTPQRPAAGMRILAKMLLPARNWKGVKTDVEIEVRTVSSLDRTH